MLDTIRDLLGLTKQQTEDLYSGSYSLKDFGTGPAAMQKALGAVNVTREYQTQLQALKTAGTLSAKDAIVRRLKALRGLKDTGISPADLMISKVPVLPPIFRPITVNNKFDIVSDANVLYKDYMIANENLKEASKVLPDSELVEYRRNCMNTYGALVGLMDPVRAQHKNMGVRGLLGEVFGSGPKQSMFQKRLLGTQSDLASRSVVVSNHNLNMDQIGIPEDHAWKLYNPFVVRALVKRAGANRDARTWALDQVEKRTDMARTALDIAMKEMPVLATRAPALHRYSMMGFEPVIVPGKAFHVNPSVMAGLNCDCDGDAVLNKVFAIVPETVYNTDIALQHKEVRMSAYFKTNVVAIGEGKRLILVDLEDFPHNKGCLTKDHIDFYTVPEGIDVLAMDEATGRVTATPVSHWSVHHDREIEIVTLTGGRQIITDDDPRAVYGLDIDTFTWCRRRPSEAGRIMVPVVTNDTSQWEQTASIDLPRNCTDRLVDTLPLTFDIGYAFGSTVGDGWVNGMEGSKQISIANSDPKIHQEWSRAMTEFFREPPKVGYLDPGMEGKFANAKHVFRSTVSSAALATAFGEWIGRGSKQKHLPPFTWSAPTEFKLGLLSGLLDTDGSIIISHSKAKLQYSVSYYSSSIRLVQEVQHLCRTLGVMTHIGSYKAPGGGDAWLVSISGPDVIKGLSGVRLFSEERAKRLEAMRSNPPKSNGRALGRRLMPMPPWLADELCKLIPSSVNKYSTVFMARGKGHMSKAGALDILEYLESNGLVCNHPLFGMWQNLVKQDYYHFERVKKVDKTGVKETGYDLTVPGFETFMSLDGIILSNTMAAHMVVSSKAADEVRRKMLASTNLRSPSDFGAHMTPRQEFLLGLYIASQAKGGKYHKFGTKQEAINAFKRGEVDLKDNVVIGT